MLPTASLQAFEADSLRLTVYCSQETGVSDQSSYIGYRVWGILIQPGEPLARGYCKLDPEKKRDKRQKKETEGCTKIHPKSSKLNVLW